MGSVRRAHRLRSEPDGLAGLGTGFCYPLYLELAAEITHPAPEGVSSCGIGLTYNVGALLVLSVEARVDPSSINLIMVATIGGAALLLTMVRESYRRSEHEETCRNAGSVVDRLLPVLPAATKAA